MKNLLKQFVTIVLCLTFFTHPVSAAPEARGSLKALFDELNYSLSVEWDQKDQAFYKMKTAQFEAGLETLRAQGLTNEELLEFARTQIKNGKVQSEYDALMLMLKADSLKPDEANKMVSDLIRKNYNQGASWSGDPVAIGLGIVLVGLIALIIIGAVNCNNGKWDCTCGETADDPCVYDSSDDSDDDDWDDDDWDDDDWDCDYWDDYCY
jgi:hypothetical protein